MDEKLAQKLRVDGHRLSYAGYANILRCIQTEPMTANQVGEIVNKDARTVLQVLQRMRDLLSFVRIWGWRKNSHKGKWVPIFEPGEGADVPYPGKKAPPAHKVSSWTVRPDLIAFCATLQIIVDEGPCSRKQLRAAGGLSPRGLLLLTNHCRSIGLMRIEKWERRTESNGAPMGLWGLGNLRDAPKPARKPPGESVREYQRRRAATLRVIKKTSQFGWIAPVLTTRVPQPHKECTT